MTEEREQAIIECYLRTGTYEGVRQELGHSPSTIWKVIKNAGICKGRGGNQKFKITDEQILEDIALGLTRQEIADKRGVHVANLARRMRKLGIHATYAKREYKSLSDWHYTKSADDYIKEHQGEGFEFVAYFHGRYRMKCKSCGYVIERAKSTIRDNKCRCDMCVKQEKEEKRLEKERIELMRFVYVNRAKVCSCCKKEFYSLYSTTVYCSESCKRKAKRLRNKERNPEIYKQKRKKNNLNHHYKSRAKKYGCAYENGITRIEVIKRDNYICQICGKRCDPNDKSWGSFGPDYPTLDHIIPLAKGGPHSWDNVQCACGECNSNKRDLTR